MEVNNELERILFDILQENNNNNDKEIINILQKNVDILQENDEKQSDEEQSDKEQSDEEDDGYDSADDHEMHV